MATLADSLKSSAGRALTLRKRPDLSVSQQRYQGRLYWVVKEPVGLRYYRFQEEEFAILQMLDGTISFDEIRMQFQKRFAPQKITLGDLQQFVGMLHRNGLVVSTAPGQGVQLKRRRDERRRKEFLAKLSNVLAIRFKGVDPDRFLTWLYRYMAWFFSTPAVVCCLLMAVGALILITVQFDVFRSKLPAFHEFFGPSNWLWLGVTLAITKILHELGHGLSCKHFGGECHEIGVMILVLTPCLYCNVSDSWMLPSKWKRAAIGAAGMYVEILLASAATFVWWFSEPGMPNHLALRVMFICSISTVLFNGNPLLRFDGYYILSDVVEIPNLRQKSSSILNRMMAKWCLGMELPEEPFLPQRNQLFFALYTVAAIAYRWIIMLSILWFLYKVFEPYGLQVIGQAIAAMAIGGMVLQPLWNLGKFFSTPGRMQQVKRKNLLVTVATVTVLIAGILFVPLPHRVNCSLELRARDAKLVYVEVPGRLEEVYVRPGDTVEKGQTLATFKNTDLRVELARLDGTLGENSVRLRYLESIRARDQKAHFEFLQLSESQKAVKEQLEDKNEELERLVVTAPCAGTVLPPPPHKGSQRPEGMLPAWTGLLTDMKNLGTSVDKGQLFCEIGDPQKMEALLVIDQADIEEVAPGQSVAIKLDAYPGRTFYGQIEEIARADLRVAPRTLSNMAGGDLATRTDASGVTRPMSTSYRARVPLDTDQDLLHSDLRGRAKISTRWQPLGSRLWRFLAHTFHFTL